MNELALLVALAVECVFFAGSVPAFATWGNFFEVLRFSVELGLLAIALTPILVTGGIDLSVGSTIGMTAVLFGMTVQHVSAGLAVAIALGIGLAAGALNAR